LVVLAVVGILAALLLTAVSNAKAKAQRIQCVNNLHQIGIALEAFVTDNSTYPLYVNPEHHQGLYPADLSVWMITLQQTEISTQDGSTNKIPFSKWSSQGVWICPSANALANSLANGELTTACFSYGYNWNGLS